MNADVAVVGAGVIGQSIAWRAARGGLEVLLIDPTPGRGASYAAAGMLAPVSEAAFGEEELVALLLEGASRWARFSEELEAASGRAVGYRACGTILVGVDRDDRALIDQFGTLYARLALEAQHVGREALRALVPALNPQIPNGVHVPFDHQVDNTMLLDALAVASAQASVVTFDSSVQSVSHYAGGKRWRIILDHHDPVAVDNVVVAAGASTPRLGGLTADLLPPVFPVKGHVLRVAGNRNEPLLNTIVRGVVEGRSCYLVPRNDGSIVIGATSEERGYDSSIQVGGVFQLLRDARMLVPGVDELELIDVRVGLRPGSPDNAPFVGPSREPGLYFATGHYRNGILLAPLTADVIVSHLLCETPPFALTAHWPRPTRR